MYLSMVSKVKEGQSVTITCNAESFPLSTFELKKSLPDLSSSERFFSQPANDQNSFTHTFNVTSTHAGLYTCIASNSEGSNSSNQRKLEVECESCCDEHFLNIKAFRFTLEVFLDSQMKESCFFFLVFNQ